MNNETEEIPVNVIVVMPVGAPLNALDYIERRIAAEKRLVDIAARFDAELVDTGTFIGEGGDGSFDATFEVAPSQAGALEAALMEAGADLIEDDDENDDQNEE